MRSFKERSGRIILLLAALVSIATVLLITIFIFQQGVPVFGKVSVLDFLFSTKWLPTGNPPAYGILSFVWASFMVTALSLLFATPVALAVAVYLAEFAKGRRASILRSSIELLAGIPSIIYGLFGIAVIVPAIRNIFGGTGYSLLAAAIILAIMILPTIINISEVSIRAVNDELRYASVAMGATKWETISRVVLPAAKSGIFTSIILGLGRSVGETTAVLLVGGNAAIFARTPLDMGRTLTMNIITDMSYAEGTHLQSLFATAMLLFIVILVLNYIVVRVARHSRMED
ncbi:phosphate ABC transporter permease subunit PstC [Parasphaerochaeta coccoides]|uniref:phosphate ABC transporter permease subunit PstC n=1 Tax=Parasphaerochaeta coccoides TaxID=273376 RepID=UPI00059DD0E0|nr:phosphate ABC transporter permease subunit PstC [Parasphaerochaeta coccoides]